MESESLFPFSNILVPVDRSQNAAAALDYALKLAKKIGSKITILHVIEPLPTAPDTHIGIHAIEVAAEDEAKKFLNDLADKADKEYSIRPEIMWRVGHPSKVIIEISENSVDLIIMGSRGLGGFKEMLLGSVSHTVINHARVPVMVVR